MVSKTVALHLKAIQLRGELRQLSPDTLHYVRHGIANERELALMAAICEYSQELLELLPQIGDKPQ